MARIRKPLTLKIEATVKSVYHRGVMMPYQISWMVPNHVIYLKVTGHHTLEEAREFDQELQPYFDAGSSSVHIILDFSQVEQVPLRPDKIKAVQSFMQHPHFGWGVVVGANQIIRFIASVIFQMVTVRFRMVNSLDAAVDFLKENDPALAEQEFSVPPVND